jgi:hypothetical protein
MAKDPAHDQDQREIESQATQPEMSPVHTTAATLMARPVSRAPRMPMANSLKITKQADTFLATAAVIMPSRPGGRMRIT